MLEMTVFNFSKNCCYIWVIYILQYNQREYFSPVRDKTNSEVAVPNVGLCKAVQGNKEAGGHANLVFFTA